MVIKRRFVLLLCVVMLSFVPAFAEEEVSVFQTLQTEAPAVTAVPQATEAPSGLTALPSEGSQPEATELPDGSTSITITAVGDTTIGGDARKSGKSLFDKELDKHGGDVSFIVSNVKDIFKNDDLTIANFEGTLTKAPIPSNKKSNQFLFSAPKEYASFLRDGHIEAVSFENNHAMDHGEQGVQDTIQAFKDYGIIFSNADHIGEYTVNGIRIGMLAFQTFDRYPMLFEKIPGIVAEAKAKYDLVIVSYHWGRELDYSPNNNQVKLGRMTIDAGADLVIGHHSHRINPIEKYKGRYIAYSLGNFSFAGNSKPSDMCTFLLQVRFSMKEGMLNDCQFRIIPARISSKSDYNDFIPTPYTEQRLIDNVIKTLKSNGKRLEYAVDSYPVDWK